MTSRRRSQASRGGEKRYVKPSLPPAKVFGPRDTLYFINFDAPVISNFQAQSAAVDQRCLGVDELLTEAVPVVRGPNLLDVFSPPFTIEARP